jgi:hypothetical protein
MSLRTAFVIVGVVALSLVLAAGILLMRGGSPSTMVNEVVAASPAPASVTAPTLPASDDFVAPSQVNTHDDAIEQREANVHIAAAARRAAAEALPFERTLYTGNVLHSGRAEALMRREDFDRELARLEQEMLKDPLAIEQRDAYADKLTAQLAGDPDRPRVSKLVCGVNLCIGAIEAETGEAYRRWMAKQFVQGRKFNDIQTMTVGPSVRVGNRVERRFVFSTSPEINAIGSR